jgi:hypothetical protein
MTYASGSAMSVDAHASACLYARPTLEASDRAIVIAGEPNRYAYLRTNASEHILVLELEGVGAQMPISVTVSPAMLDSALATPRSIWISRHRISTPTMSATVTHWRDQRMVLRECDAKPTLSTLKVDPTWLTRSHPVAGRDGFIRRVCQFGEDLRYRSVREISSSTKSLIGLGPGSTPAGDDVVAGAAATLWALGRLNSVAASAATSRLGAVRAAIESCVSRTTPLSAELLACSYNGHVIDQLQRFVSQCRLGRVPRCLAGLREVGHTSGTALAAGAVIALQSTYDKESADLSVA